MSSKRLPPSLDERLARSPQLAYYFRKAASTAPSDNNIDIEALLPDALKPHVSAVIDQRQQLNLFASNNAVAQLLRFHAERLRQATGAQRAKVMVAPVANQPAKNTEYQRQLPREAADMLQELAQTVNPPLRDALLRLASQATSG